MSKIPVEQRGTFQVDNTYWRSLEQIEDTPAFREFVEREFQDGASELKDPIQRRTFLKLMSAAAGMAGLAACRRPVEKILPYAQQPEDLIPGVPQHYASVVNVSGEMVGVVVEAHEGRPTKLEGNPLHPSSHGATDALTQATVLDVYDVDRSPSPRSAGVAATWAKWDEFALTHFKNLGDGKGFAVLSEPVLSPTLARLRGELAKKLPAAKWYEWESVNEDNQVRGLKLAFGKGATARHDYAKADVVLALDADFLENEVDVLNASKQFAARRNPDGGNKMNRLYAVEGAYSVTGATADHRLRVKPSQVHTFARALVAELVKQGLTLPGSVPADFVAQAQDAAKAQWDTSKPFVASLAADLLATKGASVIVAGRAQPPAVHAIAAVLNAALGNVGATVSYQDADEPALAEQLKELATRAGNKELQTVLVLGGNPVYDAPADLKLGEKLAGVNTIHLSSHYDETGAKAKWHLPRAHALECWGDGESASGAVAIQQPVILPLLGGRSDIEIVAQVLGLETTKGYELVRETFKGFATGDFEKQWRKALHDGVVTTATTSSADTAAKPIVAAVAEATRAQAAKDGFDVVFVPGTSTWDGRFANNAWMQELPDPMTKLTWDNAALLSPETAKKLGVKSEDKVKITTSAGAIDSVVWVQPGTSDDTVVLTLGYGRSAELGVAAGVGVDVNPLRSADAQFIESGAKVEKTSGTYVLANTQDHHFIATPSILGSTPKPRPVVREATLEQYKEKPTFARDMVKHPPLVSLFTEHAYTGHAWAMSIDLNSCTGCNVCTVACQAENNIPVVGKDQVRRGREMHWIRLDRYFANAEINKAGEIDVNNPRVVHQPMACQHCENAPCEQVCPATATAHGPEGTNDMQYSRCVGTRYCSNNCPYKVRRFNFLNWHDGESQRQSMVYNPDVTVRMRGIMEKCSYCVQRINRGKLQAKLDKRVLKDGEIVMACEQACPSGAIVFGDMNDKTSRVAKARENKRRYDVLAELNVKPRTTYLARIRNPHPQLG